MFTVWVDNVNGDGGWFPSEDLPDLEAVLDHIHTQAYSHKYRVTRDVKVQLTEQDT
jgi:hypothetical protein